MNVMYVLVIILLIISIVSTILIAGKGEDHYGTSTKRNFTNLSVIYVIFLIVGLIGLGVYIRFFT
jgi:hypothetical protein